MRRSALFLLSTFIVVTVGLVFFVLNSFADDRIKIAIIDTGMDHSNPYLCSEGHRDFTGFGLEDHIGHGTIVEKLASENLDPRKYCLLIFKWIHSGGTPEELRNSQLAFSIEAAVLSGARIINMSLSGSYPIDIEEALIRQAIKAGIHVVVAAGNEGENLSRKCGRFPACYSIHSPRFHVVANYVDGRPVDKTNYGGPVTNRVNGRYTGGGIYGTGSSFSAARVTNWIARHLK